ncbi:hypothetical protein L1987_46961 [Smallanthus sonchifolius]|uniref:Uncharacterized protein n=1 Tax=Smallanthus sonchifolius TaxID=185202 RepID=A0ACB9G1B3_9ASTR|nr:hypothetical protein L1987_46961 [Smallanthus sonchifolius]
MLHALLHKNVGVAHKVQSVKPGREIMVYNTSSTKRIKMVTGTNNFGSSAAVIHSRPSTISTRRTLDSEQVGRNEIDNC